MSRSNKQRDAAYASGKELIDRLRALDARCMEQVVDRSCWLFMERWLLPNGVGLMVIYNHQYREVFSQVAPFTGEWADTDAELARIAVLTPASVKTPEKGS